MNKISKTVFWIGIIAAGGYVIYRRAGKTVTFQRQALLKDPRGAVEGAKQCFNSFLKDFKAAQSEREEQLSRGLINDQ